MMATLLIVSPLIYACFTMLLATIITSPDILFSHFDDAGYFHFTSSGISAIALVMRKVTDGVAAGY